MKESNVTCKTKHGVLNYTQYRWHHACPSRLSSMFVDDVLQDGKVALLACANNKFLSVESSSDELVCRSLVAGPAEWLTLRCNRCLDRDPKLDLPEEERDSVRQAEVNYARKFQSWQVCVPFRCQCSFITYSVASSVV